MNNNPKRTRSLRWRVLLMLGMALVVTSALTAFAIYRFISDAEKDLWVERRTEASIAATAEVTAFLRRVDTLMTSGAVVETDSSASELFRQIIEQETLIEEALLVTKDAEVIAHTGDEEVFSNVFTMRQANWFLGALAGEPYFGELQYTADNVPYIVLAYPTPAGNVVAARLNMQRVNDVITNLHFGETGQVYLIDPDGWLIGSDTEATITENIQERPEFSNALADPNTRWTGTYENYVGKQVAGNISLIPGTDWLLAVEADQSEITAVSRQAILYLIIGTLLFGLVTIFATSRLLGYFVFSPLTTLLQGTHAVEAGNLNYQIDVFNNDEIGTVTTSFNAMTKRLQQREADHDAAEARLAQSERQYRQILDAIGDMVLVKGEKSRIVWANKSFRDYYNMSNEALQGLIDAPFNEPDYTQQYIIDDAKVFYSGQPLTVEEPVTRYDGVVRQFNTLKTPIFDENNQVVMTVGVSRDMTETLNAQTAIRDREGQLRQLIKNLTPAIAMFDTQMRYLQANDSWIKSYKLEGQEIIGKGHYEIFPEIGEDWKEIHRKCLAGEVNINERAAFPRADGSNDWLRWDVRPWYQEDGNIGGVLMYTEIITQRIEAELERERLIKELRITNRIAQENSRLKSEFLATMSHELRTPLNAIEGFTSIVLNHMGGAQYNDKTERYVQRIHTNSRRLLELINDFLDLSRIESGRLELANMPFSPARLGEKWQAEIGGLAEKKGLDFIVEVAPDLPETVYGDEEAISKVAINLMGNAIKFTEKGAIKVNLMRQDEEWLIEVVDTGIGIPPHAREYIFEEFRQVDQTSRRKYGGTGLGLAIVQKMTRLMGGTVTLKSEMGKGSTFTVTLPIRLEPIQAQGVTG